MPQYVQRQAALAGALPQALPGGLRGLRTSGNREDTILIGETSPRGNSHVVAPAALPARDAVPGRQYRKAKSCASCRPTATPTTRTRRAPARASCRRQRDDVTIGVLSRLITALDKAGRRGALPKRPADPPDRVRHPVARRTRSPASRSQRQAAYLAIAEHMAYVNPRVALFSQYLMSDDPPRTSGYRYGGFESGLRTRDGKKKPAYQALPRCRSRSRRYGSSDVLWGLVRPQPADDQGDDRGRKPRARRLAKLGR